MKTDKPYLESKTGPLTCQSAFTMLFQLGYELDEIFFGPTYRKYSIREFHDRIKAMGRLGDKANDFKYVVFHGGPLQKRDYFAGSLLIYTIDRVIRQEILNNDLSLLLDLQEDARQQARQRVEAANLAWATP